MDDLPSFLAYILSAMGLTVLLVWPQAGPGAWMRERVLRRALPKVAHGALDCYICLGFWCGLILSPPWWAAERRLWCLTGCLMVPALFWWILKPVE